jgi:hypothetical protein
MCCKFILGALKTYQNSWKFTTNADIQGYVIYFREQQLPEFEQQGLKLDLLPIYSGSTEKLAKFREISYEC